MVGIGLWPLGSLPVLSLQFWTGDPALSCILMGRTHSITLRLRPLASSENTFRDNYCHFSVVLCDDASLVTAEGLHLHVID